MAFPQVPGLLAGGEEAVDQDGEPRAGDVPRVLVPQPGHGRLPVAVHVGQDLPGLRAEQVQDQVLLIGRHLIEVLPHPAGHRRVAGQHGPHLVGDRRRRGVQPPDQLPQRRRHHRRLRRESGRPGRHGRVVPQGQHVQGGALGAGHAQRGGDGFDEADARFADLATLERGVVAGADPDQVGDVLLPQVALVACRVPPHHPRPAAQQEVAELAPPSPRGLSRSAIAPLTVPGQVPARARSVMGTHSSGLPPAAMFSWTTMSRSQHRDDRLPTWPPMPLDRTRRHTTGQWRDRKGGCRGRSPCGVRRRPAGGPF